MLFHPLQAIHNRNGRIVYPSDFNFNVLTNSENEFRQRRLARWLVRDSFWERTFKEFGLCPANPRVLWYVKEFEINDSSANRKYLGKIIETDGIVKEVSKDEAGYYTVVLGEEGKMSAIRCSMDTVHKQDASRLKVGSSVVIRGSCTGFNKDEMGLGSDVILNFCVIVSTK